MRSSEQFILQKCVQMSRFFRRFGVGVISAQVITFCVVLSGSLAWSEDDPLGALLDSILDGPHGTCRAMVAEQRIAEWRGGPFVAPAFATVEELMEPIEGVERLIEAGCDGVFVWSFMSCTQLHDPNGIRVSPRRPSAPTEVAFARVLERCFAELEEWGVQP